MLVAIEEKKAEAIRRMKSLGIFKETIRQFDGGKVSISEPPFGAFYWAEGDDLKLLREFEIQHNALVYVVIRSYTELGVMDSYLYVSDHQEEWPDDRACLKSGEACAYVSVNGNDPMLSEFGYIGFAKTIAGGLKRTW